MENIDEMKEALECAKGILDYVSGDAWEREVTQPERDRFYELYEKLFPRTKPEPIRSPYCKKCARSFPHDFALESHLKHSRKHHDERSDCKIFRAVNAEDSHEGNAC